MKGIILASGEGTRLRPLTNNKPKVMLKINNKPVLEYNINILKKAGISDIIITVYYKQDIITDYFKDGGQFNVNIIYSHEDRLLGSAEGVKNIDSDITSSFVVIYGDNFSNCNLRPVLECHRENRPIATIVLFNREKNLNSKIAGGCVKFDNRSNRILEFIEGKGSITNYVNAGIYILEPEVLDFIPDNTFCDFGKDVFPLLLSKGKTIYGYLMPENEYLFGIDNVECYKKTKEFFENKLKGELK